MKFDPLTLAMNEKRQMVAYVVIFAVVDQFKGSFGSLLGIGSYNALSVRIATHVVESQSSHRGALSPGCCLSSSSPNWTSDIFVFPNSCDAGEGVCSIMCQT